MTEIIPLMRVTCPDATCAYPNPANMATIATCAAIGTGGLVECMQGSLHVIEAVEQQGGEL